ncbi:sporozoite surface protein 2-like [Nymphalis io]|uniref:sporozoite surface protein 2-like n=1 Tax=Inachis io TaxID=171585 RepID=UPI00216737D3|nr:sporozoite surface protein 2-like [Nymphalis io]
MSDNEDLLGDDLGDHSLADYNLGNEEEEQLLADDYDSGPSQNVPSSNNSSYNESVDTVPTVQGIEYAQPGPYTQPEPECVVPNIIVEVPNVTQTEHTTYATFNEPYEQEHAVPPAIPAAPVESPQIVPSELPPAPKSVSQRSPRTRNIPDSLDKVFVPRNSYNGRGRSSWRNPHYRQNHPYRRNNTFRGNFAQRPSFPPPNIRPPIPNQLPNRPDIPDNRPNLPQMPRALSPERPLPPPEIIQPSNPPIENRPFNQNFQRFQFRNEEPNFVPNIRPNYERPMFYQRPYNPRQFGPRDMMPNNMPQVIRQPLPLMTVNLPKGREPEVRMLPVLPPNLPNLPPGGLAGKKVLINPHFKGNFQPPVEGLPTYVPTRIQKSPPLSPTLESKFGPIKDIDDAAERFIAEQRSALARAQRRHRAEPQRYIENTTIEIENDLARSCEDRELLRKQEEFINANRAGLRRRMRSPSPPRSPSPRRSPERRPRASDEESEYRRRVREQECLRERVLRAKELRRRKSAAALQRDLADRYKDQPDKEVPKEEIKQTDTKEDKQSIAFTNDTQQVKPDTTRKTPEREKETEIAEEKKETRDRSPIKVVESAEANSTCETLTPPPPSPERGATPPLPPPARAPLDSDDDLDLILDDIDDILSDDDDSGRFKEKASKDEGPKTVEKQVDLRSKLPPKVAEPKKPRQKITFNDNSEDKRKKDKSPVRRSGLGANKTNHAVKADTKTDKAKSKVEVNATTIKSRQKITFDKKDAGRPAAPARRVVLRKAAAADPSQPTPCIFSRAVRTAIAPPAPPGPPPAPAAPAAPAGPPPAALVRNLPPGITDTRLRTLAADSQSLSLDKEERSAIIIFKTGLAAENFKKKFNNKMVAASRLTVTLQ